MIQPTAIDGLFTVQRKVHADHRGFFYEIAQLAELEQAAGRPIAFLQQNHARSGKGVLRGLHAENWDKLVYVPHGRVFTAVADIRPESPTFRRVATFTLGGLKPLALFVSSGLAHGYYVLSEEADYVYLVSAYYDGSDTRAVRWDDPDLAVPWPDRSPVISDRDRTSPLLRDLIAGSSG